MENSFLRMRGNSKRSEGSGMLIGDPLGEGSTASSTDNELWRAENSFLRMRGNSPLLFLFFLFFYFFIYLA